MKKTLAVFMAVLMTLTSLSVAALATAPGTTAAQEVNTDIAVPEETTAAATVEEKTTRNIKNEDGLVVPINLNQLKNSVIFKIVEKIFKFILSLFGVNGPDVDNEGATIVDEIGNALDERLSHIFG